MVYHMTKDEYSKEELEEANRALQKEIILREQLEKKLVRTERLDAIGRLAGGVANDLNSMLTVILGQCEIMLEDTPSSKGVRDIQFAAERSARLVRQLLAFSRKQIMQPRELDLNKTIKGMIEVLRKLAGAKIEVKTALALDLARIEADPTQLEQILVNVVDNAREAMEEGGKLILETATVEVDATYAAQHEDLKPGNYVRLAISDTGHGMDRETRERVFEPFFTTRKRGEGSGLGLSSVYGIVRQSKGGIVVYSEPGNGTTLKLYLPIVKENEDSVLTASPASEQSGLQGSETILIVDDKGPVLDLLIDFLKSRGYRILAAEGPVEALMLARDHDGPIHLLLTDVIMPKMNGDVLAKRMMADRKEMKVVYMSGYSSSAAIQLGVLRQGENFLEKPFSQATLLAKVRQTLDSTPREAPTQ